ncbi:hypothetical protein ACFWDF_33930 [Streptomyces diastaticus]|uniref:hypothetical protein n=1 Tax=Streptomyces diastaticus TaxID=1956 RepID=UPI0036B0335F
MNTPANPAAFQPGDRVVCADGVARTVRGMATQRPQEPACVVTEDGVEWIAAHCRRANREDVAAARTVSAYAAALAQKNPDLNLPQRSAALADLDMALTYRDAAETDATARNTIAAAHSPAGRDLAGLATRRGTGADDPTPEGREEAALQKEACALFAVLSQDGHAHAFQRVQPFGAEHPVGWTYRTGYGANVRYGWITAHTGKRGATTVEHRWQAEEATAGAAVLAGTAVPSQEHCAAMTSAELCELVDRLRDRASRTLGVDPRHVLDQDVAAALQLLAAWHFAEVPRGFNPAAKEGCEDHDPSVTGLVVVPAANGHVTALWVENGRYVTPAGDPFRAQCRALREEFENAGWKVVPGTVRVVTAYRPTP